MSVRRQMTIPLDVEVIRQLTDAAKDAGVSRAVLVESIITTADWTEAVEAARNNR